MAGSLLLFHTSASVYFTGEYNDLMKRLLRLPTICSTDLSLVDEVDTEEVEEKRSEYVVCKCCGLRSALAVLSSYMGFITFLAMYSCILLRLPYWSAFED